MNWTLFSLTVACTALILSFSTAARGVLTPKIQDDIKDWLVGLRDKKEVDKQWPEIFIKVFDQFYGKKIWTWKRLWKSVVTGMFVIVVIVNHDEYTTDHFLFALIFIPFLNFFPDFFSLQQTRWILKVMSQSGIMSTLLLFALDIAMNFLLFSVPAAILIAVSADDSSLFFMLSGYRSF